MGCVYLCGYCFCGSTTDINSMLMGIGMWSKHFFLAVQYWISFSYLPKVLLISRAWILRTRLDIILIRTPLPTLTSQRKGNSTRFVLPSSSFVLIVKVLIFSPSEPQLHGFILHHICAASSACTHMHVRTHTHTQPPRCAGACMLMHWSFDQRQLRYQ